MRGEDYVRFRVAGLPVPQGSMTAIRLGKHARLVPTKSSRRTLPAWRSDVVGAAEAEMGDAPPFLGPLELTVTFLFPRGVGHFGSGKNAGTLKASAPYWRATMPDLDKLVRAVMDALKVGGVYRDDAQVVAFGPGTLKRYGERPGATILVRCLPEGGTLSLDTEASAP